MQARHTANTKPRITRGFTLAEALIASVFLAIAALGVAGAMNAAAQQAIQAKQSTGCQVLAKELMEEVASKSFTTQANPGHSSGVLTRYTYDDMGDYDGYTDNTTAGIKTLQGTAVDLGDGATYTRTVSFDYRTTPGGSKVASGDFGLATVTVTSGGGASVKLQRLFSKPVLDNVINR